MNKKALSLLVAAAVTSSVACAIPVGISAEGYDGSFQRRVSGSTDTARAGSAVSRSNSASRRMNEGADYVKTDRDAFRAGNFSGQVKYPDVLRPDTVEPGVDNFGSTGSDDTTVTKPITNKPVFDINDAPERGANRPIKVTVGGEALVTDVEPIAINGRTMLPVRAVAEALGAKVNYISAEKKVVITNADKTIEFVLDSDVMKVNGEEKKIDVPATIKDNRTLVPLRACAEAFGLNVEWNQNTYTAKVKKPVSLITKTRTDEFIYDDNGNMVQRNSLATYVQNNTYDENGNIVYSEDTFGNRVQYTYDKYGNLVFVEEEDGSWVWRKYDCNDREIYYEDSEGNRTESVYDNNGNLISSTDEDGYTVNCTYDANGHITYMKDTDGFWSKYSYDANGNNTYYETSDNYWIKYTYDENGELIMADDSEGEWIKYSYNENGDLVKTEDSEGTLSAYTFDENGNVLTKTFNGELSEAYTYDKNGNILTYRTGDGYGVNYTYGENGNLLYSEDSYGVRTEYVTREK